MLQKYFDGAVPARGSLTESDQAIDALAVSVTERCADAAIAAFAPHEAIAAVWELVDALNGYITEQQPWALAKDDANRERLGTVLTTALRGLGTVAVLLSPVMPKATEKLWASIGVGGSIAEQRVDRAFEWQGASHVVALESGLFPRIEQSEQVSA
ncbi:class I tRNA ligase family protein [Sphingomonas sp. LR61]|uniref:class I tRNA ligase family protein n=1 Tax=Sphingomonas sp. LR61 TaxID=3050234 RepID=UPI002FDF36EB